MQPAAAIQQGSSTVVPATFADGDGDNDVVATHVTVTHVTEEPRGGITDKGDVLLAAPHNVDARKTVINMAGELHRHIGVARRQHGNTDGRALNKVLVGLGFAVNAH